MKNGFFSSKIVEWYKDHHRDLPWRKTQDPYRIWLSEIILQQTRVLQGLPYYQKFINSYPDILSLAEASEQEILRLWQGLGYYSRARNLRKCAQVISAHHGARFPSTASKLLTLPGIGTYTAAAIASFAFEERIAVVDGNVYRLLARHFGIDKNISTAKGKNAFAKLANQLLPAENPGLHNQAMMEFGALHCLPINPKCDSCIFKNSCRAFRNGNQQLLPVKSRPKKSVRRYFYYFVIRRGEKMLMKERKGRDIWTGLFDFPLQEEKRIVSLKRIQKVVLSSMVIGAAKGLRITISHEYKHVLTHQIIYARFIEVHELGKGSICKEVLLGSRYYSKAEIVRLPKPQLISRYMKENDIL